MAVVFISPKKTQQTFLMGIAALLFIFLIFISFIVFFSQPSAVSPEKVFNKSKVNIDMTVLDSEQFKNLIPFEEIPLQFYYEALNEKNRQVTGVISATSEQEAVKKLEADGLSVGLIYEVEAGRDDPFSPYLTSEE